jgi:hypothetical protein
MHSASGIGRKAGIVTIALALTLGCGRWQPAKSYEVTTQVDEQTSYTTVLDVASSERYTVVSKDDVAKKVRLEARVSGSSASSKSFIDVEVVGASVKLAAAGHLVKDGKVHKSLGREVSSLEGQIKKRLASGASSATPPAAEAPEEPVAAASGVPQAWSEPAYDPSVWGNGNFTCLPVKVPAEHQAALTIQLSNGEKADLQLSLAYAPELCRSPAQCKVPGGCPALGIGDPERVNRIAARLSKGEVASQAILLDSGKAVANIDLSKHGSIVQAMSELKR